MQPDIWHVLLWSNMDNGIILLMKYTGKQLKRMSSMDFTLVIQVLPLDMQLRLSIARIDFDESDYNEIADILNKWMQLMLKGCPATLKT